MVSTLASQSYGTPTIKGYAAPESHHGGTVLTPNGSDNGRTFGINMSRTRTNEAWKRRWSSRKGYYNGADEAMKLDGCEPEIGAPCILGAEPLNRRRE